MKIVSESKSECPRIPPKMKIVTESKSECPRIPPKNENCHRVQIQVSQNTPPNPNFQLFFLSPNPKVPECPPQNPNFQLFSLVQIQRSQNTPPNPNFQLFFLSPNPRVPEYPPYENCQRVQIQASQNTPPMKIVRESKSECPRIAPPKSKLPTFFPKSKSECPRIPPPPNWNLAISWHFEYFQFWHRSTPPPIGLESGRSYVETNLYRPLIPLVFTIDLISPTGCWWRITANTSPTCRSAAWWTRTSSRCRRHGTEWRYTASGRHRREPEAA